MKKDHKVTDYIQYQKGIVDDKLCWRLTNKQFEFKPSGYATHGSGKVVKTDRVLMDDAWIKSNDELYADVKISFEKTIEKYIKEDPFQQRNPQIMTGGSKIIIKQDLLLGLMEDI